MIKHLWRWHPKVALRYLPIIRKIKQLGLIKGSILEIGSGSLGITPYLGRPVVGLDINFSGPQIEFLTKVKGSAINIPFKDRSFDIVLMVDVLEHLEPNKRKKAIIEAIRVARKLLVISFPSGKKALEEDNFLSNDYKKIYGGPFPFYQEHLQYGFPQVKQVNDTITNEVKLSERKVNIKIEGNVNLGIHRFLMKGWITKNIFIDIIFRKLFLLLIPIFLFFNKEPTYRKIFYIKFK